MIKLHFRTLTEKEEKIFRKSARATYKPFEDINGTWHPIYQEECVKINKENAIYE